MDKQWNYCWIKWIKWIKWNKWFASVLLNNISNTIIESLKSALLIMDIYVFHKFKKIFFIHRIDYVCLHWISLSIFTPIIALNARLKHYVENDALQSKLLWGNTFNWNVSWILKEEIKQNLFTTMLYKLVYLIEFLVS